MSEAGKQWRKRRQTERRAARVGEKTLFSGPVEIGCELRTLIVGAREVKSKMSRRMLLRTTCRASLGEYGSGNIVVLYDKRALCGAEHAEIIRTNRGDLRVHIRLRSPLDGRVSTPLDVDRGDLEWACLTSACARMIEEGS